MAEVITTRWTDKPLAKLALTALGFVAVACSSGLGWMVSKAVANEAANARQDETESRMGAEIKEMRENAKTEHAEVMQAIRDVRADIKDLRK